MISGKGKVTCSLKAKGLDGGGNEILMEFLWHGESVTRDSM
jgi:hypothetical protein